MNIEGWMKFWKVGAKLGLWHDCRSVTVLCDMKKILQFEVRSLFAVVLGK